MDESTDRSLTIIRSAVVTHPRLPFSPEQMRWNRFRSEFPDAARRINKSARLTRRILSAGIWRYYVVIEADVTAHLLKNFLSATVPRAKPIIRTKK
jgi:hypothetical protein